MDNRGKGGARNGHPLTAIVLDVPNFRSRFLDGFVTGEPTFRTWRSVRPLGKTRREENR
jgi:hypothetical protein